MHPPSQGQVNFNWTAADHFAAADHLGERTKLGPVSKVATLLAPLLGGLAIVAMFDDESGHQLIGYLVGLAAFAAIAAVFWIVFMWQRGRRFFFRRASALPCGLQFDEQGIAWLIGSKHRLTYRWSEVRSVNENDEYIFVIASSNCVAIPKSAFASPLEADYFARSMRAYLGQH
jgi:YcxB-like protein